jgi:hypothetical protein
MTYILGQLIGKLPKMDTQMIFCGACILLRYTTENEDALARASAGTICTVCSLMFGREAYRYYDSIFSITKKGCQFLNYFSRLGITYWGRKGSKGSTSNYQYKPSVEYGSGMDGDGI